MTEKSIVGSYVLKSFHYVDDDGNTTYPMGRDAQGYIVYTPEGIISATLMENNRPHFALPHRTNGTPEEKSAAIDSFMAYAGKFHMQDENTVVHEIEKSIFPNWSGQAQIRNIEWTDDGMVLTAGPMIIDGKNFKPYISWRKL